MSKSYAPTFGATFHWTDKKTGETEDIAFIANGYLFPLFLSYAKEELSDALDAYNKKALATISKEQAEALVEYSRAPQEEQDKIALENSAEFWKLGHDALKAATLKNGMSLFEVLPIVMHACTMPTEGERLQTLALGYDSLPSEVYEDMDFACELLRMAFGFEDYSKKKLLHTAGRN